MSVNDTSPPLVRTWPVSHAAHCAVAFALGLTSNKTYMCSLRTTQLHTRRLQLAQHGKPSGPWPSRLPDDAASAVCFRFFSLSASYPLLDAPAQPCVGASVVAPPPTATSRLLLLLLFGAFCTDAPHDDDEKKCTLAPLDETNRAPRTKRGARLL